MTTDEIAYLIGAITPDFPTSIRHLERTLWRPRLRGQVTRQEFRRIARRCREYFVRDYEWKCTRHLSREVAAQ